MAKEADGPHRCFSTTIWSLVDRAGHGGGEEQRKALDQLLQRYRPALKAHLVHRHRLEDANADDLLQDFFVKKVLEKDLIGKAFKSYGRFRNFLLVSLDRFCISEYRHARTKKEQYASGGIPIDEGIEYSAGNARPRNPFEVEWAKQLLSDTVKKMQQNCVISGQSDVWDIFQGRMLDPILLGAEPVSYQRLVEQHGLVSPDQASDLRSTAKRKFRATLREVIGEYEPDEEMIDEEIADMIRILSGGKS